MEKNVTFRILILLLGVGIVLLGIFLFRGGATQEIDVLEVDDTSEDLAEMEEVEVSLDDSEESVTEDEPEYKGEVLAGTSSPFLDFNNDDYLAAKESGKKIMLYFYAKWCPSCKRELRNATEPAFDAYAGENVVGFRVNYSDRDTDDFEEDLAAEFGVVYQHTKVFITGDVVEVFPNTWSQAEYEAAFMAS